MKLTNILIALLILRCTSVFAQNTETGLVAHWSFDKDSLNIVFDETENQINGVASEIDYVEGVKGKSIRFDSNNDGVFFPDKTSQPSEIIGELAHGTISVWFNFVDNGPNIVPILYFGENSENEDHNSLIIEIGHAENVANKKLYFTIVNEGFCFDSNENLLPDKWYHFVAVVGPNGNTGYLNGEELVKRKYNLGSTSEFQKFFADVPVKNLLSLGYGRYGMCGRFYQFRGKIDEVRIYNRPLTAGEVKSLWDENNPVTNNNRLIQSENKFKIYPNPAQNFLNIQTEYQDQILDIYNLSGKKLKSFDLNKISKIPLTDFEKGVYIATVTNGIHSKFVVQ